MGIDNTAARLILLLRSTAEVDLQDALMLGHQRNYIGSRLARQVASEIKLPRKIFSAKYADEFLHGIGAKGFQVLDLSDYEGAQVIHDLNMPIPDALREKFSVIMDIGTSEHVYNAVQSISNIREMCKVGGHVLMLSPANNYLGHGFYQFSPELFFRSFDKEYGFEISSLYLIKMGLFGQAWYELADPRNMKRRGNILTRKRCYIGVIARKVSNEGEMESPQQSDYVSAWDDRPVSKLGAVYLGMPPVIRRILEWTVIAVYTRLRNRLTPQRFDWREGSYMPRKSGS
jgi:hypothetical protein